MTTCPKKTKCTQQEKVHPKQGAVHRNMKVHLHHNLEGAKQRASGVSARPIITQGQADGRKWKREVVEGKIEERESNPFNNYK